MTMGYNNYVNPVPINVTHAKELLRTVPHAILPITLGKTYQLVIVLINILTILLQLEPRLLFVSFVITPVQNVFLLQVQLNVQVVIPPSLEHIKLVLAYAEVDISMIILMNNAFLVLIVA